MIKEYGGKEKYTSMAAKKKHESKESKAMEKKEKMSPAKKTMSPAKKCKK